MMIKTSDVILTGLMIATAIWTFQVKYDTQESAKMVAKLQKSIAQEKDRVAILKADWAVLKQPARLQEMAERYQEELKLQPLAIEQIITPDELPPIKIPDDPIGALAQGGGTIDGFITGSIKRLDRKTGTGAGR